MKRFSKPFLLVLLFCFFDCLLIEHISERAELQRLNGETVTSDGYRNQILNDKLLEFMEDKIFPDERGTIAGIYLLEAKFGVQKFSGIYSEPHFSALKKKWKTSQNWGSYLEYCDAIWNDVKYFPVPESTVDKKLTISLVDSWMAERTYGGQRGHEGTDIMAGKNAAGVYPVLSMTDGVVTSKGWLEKGGYRIGITSPSGGYFYYAHLSDYANIEEGDTVKAGDLLGFMGDTGYGEEGTTGKFDVHLHVGIYIYPDGQETSVNPYWILKFLENHKLKYAYS